MPSKAVSLSVLVLVKSSQHGRACVSVVLRVVVHFIGVLRSAFSDS